MNLVLLAIPAKITFILAGVAVFERQTHWIEQSLNAIAEKVNPNQPQEVELHGSPMRSGKGIWRQFTQAERVQLIKDALEAGITKERSTSARLFACVIEKAAFPVNNKDAVEYCFEQLVSRFDLFLKRRHIKHNDTHRGLMLFDESSTEKRLQTLAREFKYSGHSWGKTHNYAEVPVFLDSRATRLIQLADLVAYAVFRHFEHGDSQYFDLIKDRFDSEGGVEYGLHVVNRA
jgi:Protein of unknown function (DUF3800)